MWKNYVTRPVQVSAKIYERGDEDGFIGLNQTIPYVINANGRRQYWDYGYVYIVKNKDGSRFLIKKADFEEQYASLDY